MTLFTGNRPRFWWLAALLTVSLFTSGCSLFQSAVDKKNELVDTAQQALDYQQALIQIDDQLGQISAAYEEARVAYTNNELSAGAFADAIRALNTEVDALQSQLSALQPTELFAEAHQAFKQTLDQLQNAFRTYLIALQNNLDNATVLEGNHYYQQALDAYDSFLSIFNQAAKLREPLGV